MVSGMDGQCPGAPQLEGVPVRERGLERERERERKERKGKEKKKKKKCLQILDGPQPDISP